MKPIAVRRVPLRALLCAMAFAGALAACKAPDLPTILSPYKIDIQQGNVVTQDMISRLKRGMTRAQVRFALGSPLVVDPFRTDRWDYVSTYDKQGKEVERRRITVIFENDALARIEGDVVVADPALKEGAAAPKPALAAPPAGKPVPQAAAGSATPAPGLKPVVAPTAWGSGPAPQAGPDAPVAPPPSVGVPLPANPGPSLPAAAAPREAPAPAAAAPAGEPAAPTAAPKAPATGADAAKKEAPGGDAKDAPKSPGFFGRMLEKLGF